MRVRGWLCGVAIGAALAIPTGCENDGGGLSTDVGDNDVNVVVALGDSITEGSGATPYPGILARLIGKTVINAGKGGDKAAGGAQRVGSLLTRYSPGYLLILLGTNDAIHRLGSETTISALRSIIRQAKNNGTVPVLATLTPMISDYSIFSGGVMSRNPRIRELAAEEGVALADVAAAFGDGEGLMMPNGLHPNNDGQILIAQTFAKLF